MEFQALNNWGLALQVCLMISHLNQPFVFLLFNPVIRWQVLALHLLCMFCLETYFLCLVLKFNVSGTQCNCSRSWETDYSQNCYREGIGFMHLIRGLWHLIEPIEIISVLIMYTLICLQFRAAIQLQFDFHRAIYNLGTVLVSLWHLSCPSIMFWHCKRWIWHASIYNK